jgi:hypothetical protein
MSCGAAIMEEKRAMVNVRKSINNSTTFVQRLYTAYLGAVNVNVQAGRKAGTVVLEYRGVGTNPDILIKCVDVVASRVDYTTRPSLSSLEGKTAVIVDIQKNRENYYAIQTYELQKATLANDITGIARRTNALSAFYKHEPNFALRKLSVARNTAITPAELAVLHQLYAENASVDVHFETGLMVKFMQEKFNRQSVNQSNTLLSLCNVPDLDNAYFTGEYMVYGNGKTYFYPLGSLDVSSHELTHALVAATAGLIYDGHSGAMNEHLADVVAVAFEFWVYKIFNGNADSTDDLQGEGDWTLGEDIGKAMKYLRNLKDPTKAHSPQPKMYRGEFWGDPNSTTDYGYVHGNSGVLNHFFYLLSQSTSIDTAIAIIYNTLLRLNPTSDFIDYRNIVINETPESIRSLTKQALAAVGLGPTAVSDWNRSPAKNKVLPVPTPPAPTPPVPTPPVPTTPVPTTVPYPNEHIPTIHMCCPHCQSRQPRKRRRM